MSARRVTLKPDEPLDEVRGKLAAASVERVCVTRSELVGLDNLCEGIAVHLGQEEPCCKDATTVIYDIESATIWPACSWHANRYGGALTLAQIREVLEKGATWFEREVTYW